MARERLRQCHSRCWVYSAPGNNILIWVQNPAKFSSRNPESSASEVGENSKCDFRENLDVTRKYTSSPSRWYRFQANPLRARVEKVGIVEFKKIIKMIKLIAGKRPRQHVNYKICCTCLVMQTAVNSEIGQDRTRGQQRVIEISLTRLSRLYGRVRLSRRFARHR